MGERALDGFQSHARPRSIFVDSCMAVVVGDGPSAW